MSKKAVPDVSKIKVILATDCGSTTSKARFFKEINGEYRFVVAGEAPTTVEAPYEDVTFGIVNAIKEIEELTGHRLLSDDGILESRGENEGVDLYVTTSSAGGGLQMMCSGVIKTMTSESAERAALGAGAIVLDVLSSDDGVEPWRKIRSIRNLRPDMLLVAGGTDGGTISHVVKMAELIKAADPKARLGALYDLPIVYAGNKDARDEIKNILGSYALIMVENIRPTMDVENTEPAREAIHELFMEHVMSHAPGYDKLMKWTPIPIMPTPAAEGTMFRTLAKMSDENVIGVGLGGATTNVYSVFNGRFVRTVSANLGMSYSICNVLKEAGIKNITRWIPFGVDEEEIKIRLYNKMIRPTTIPQTQEDLIIEHAVAREALRLGFQHHKLLARPLRGVAMKDLTTIDASFKRGTHDDFFGTYIRMMDIGAIGGTGGLLSHAPNRAQSMLMLTDGFQPEGVTRLFQDSVFMIPHLGVLSTVQPKAATEIFEKDCMVKLGTCIGLKGEVRVEDYGETAADFTLKMTDGTLEDEIRVGEIKRILLGEDQMAEVNINPRRRFDVGAGPNHELDVTIEGGVVGVVIDARGRPICLPEDDGERVKKLKQWFEALNLYE